MKTIILLLSLLSNITAVACVCATRNKSLEENFKEYSFIAHVKIIKKAALTANDSNLVSNKKDYSMYSKVTIEIIELYKGDAATTILEWGVNSSCDMGLSENAEWILFGNYVDKKFASVGYCNPWNYLKNKDGERQWGYDYGITNANVLRKLAGLPAKHMADGKTISYFANGNIATIEEYREDKLQGERKIYFNNGSLMESVNYVNGVPHGKAYYYKKHGQPSHELQFDDGKIIHSIYWYDTSYSIRYMKSLFNEKKLPPASVQKQMEGWVDTKTKSKHSFVYYETGELQKENRSWNDGAASLSCEYFTSGQLKSEIYNSTVNVLSLEKRWDESGKLLSDKKWENGKFIGDAIKN